MTTPNTRLARLPAAVQYCGASRAYLYKKAAKCPGLFRKMDGITFVDLSMLDAMMADLPAADIGRGRAKARTA